MKRCDQCKKPIRGAGHRTATRTLCDVCYAEYSGAVGGFLGSGSVGTAAYTSSLFRKRAQDKQDKKNKGRG